MSSGHKTNAAKGPSAGVENVVELSPLASAAAPAQCAVILGRLVGLSARGEPRVDFEENDSGEALRALSAVDLGMRDVGRAVTLTFVNGDPRQPVVSGVLRSATSAERNEATTVNLDGERLLLSAKREIVLQCGKASITLRKDGQLLLRGTYVLSRSTGPNRIKGGSIQLN